MWVSFWINWGLVMTCEDDCGMCGICSKARYKEIELNKRCDYRLEEEFDNRPFYAESKEDDYE